MDRRTFLAMLGTTGLALLALSASAHLVPVLAKDSGGGGGGSGAESGGEGAKDDKDEKAEGQDNGNNTDQPGTEAQPQDATQCAAGTECPKKE